MRHVCVHWCVLLNAPTLFVPYQGNRRLVTRKFYVCNWNKTADDKIDNLNRISEINNSGNLISDNDNDEGRHSDLNNECDDETSVVPPPDVAPRKKRTLVRDKRCGSFNLKWFPLIIIYVQLLFFCVLWKWYFFMCLRSSFVLILYLWKWFIIQKDSVTLKYCVNRIKDL